MDPWTIATFMLMLWLIMMKFPIYQRAYHDHQEYLDNTEWLFKQCQDPAYVVHMRPDSCQHVIDAFQQAPWLVATRACLPRSWPEVPWPVWLALLLFFLLGPTVLLPMYKARQDAREHKRLLRACSPELLPFHHQAIKSHFA